MIVLESVIAGDTITFPFSTYEGGTGASITMTGLAITDIEVYKDGGITQRASDNGYALLDTDGTDFDGITGLHGFSIDLSDNSDAGFYTAGPWYDVAVSAVTVDGQTVNFWAGKFRIVEAPATASALATAQSDLDTLTGTDGVTLATSQPNYTPATATALSSLVTTVGAAGAGLTEAGGTGDHLTDLPWNAAWDAEVQSEVNDGLVALGLDHLVAASVAGTDIVDNSIIAKLVSKSATADWDTFVNTTDSLEAQRDNLGSNMGGSILTDLLGPLGSILVDTNELQLNQGNWLTATSVTVSDKTGFSLASTGLELVTAWTVDITGDVTGNLSTAIAAIKAITDAIGPVAAANLAKALGAAGVVGFTVQAGTLSTTQASTDLTQATDDHYRGRVIIWITGDLAGQGTPISAYTGVGGILTYTACTEAPMAGDTGIIV